MMKTNIYKTLFVVVGLSMTLSSIGQKKEVTKKAESAAYVERHAKVDEPFEILGGPINIMIKQDEGGVFVALPDNRKLDPVIFGTPDNPRNFGGTPVITGVPKKIRDSENSQYTNLNVKSPFGNKHMIMKNGKLKIDAKDVTATDASKTEDEVKIDASWEDEQGNKFQIKCCQMMAKHGVDFPTYGGVATNMVLHGFSGTGTPLMPSEFAYFAFWGIGEVLKNGKSVDKPRLIHGMLTEYVRTENYELAFDDEVTPERRHFHILTVPFEPDLKNFSFEQKPVTTGFELENGQELPFWHVMFENLDINSSREMASE